MEDDNLVKIDPWTPRDRIEALADAWASIDGKMEPFRKGRQCKTMQEEIDAAGGHYSGYMTEAEELLQRLQRRGYDIIPIRRKV